MADVWHVILLREPQKVLARAPADLRARLLTALHALEHDPWPPGYKKLIGHENLYRVRVGDWRIIYEVNRGELAVIVAEIAPRGRAYRGY